MTTTKSDRARRAAMLANAAKMRELGQLRPNNHELWKHLQRRVNEPGSMTVIASELGIDVDALVVWMLSYTGPKRKPYLRMDGPAIASVPLSSAAQRFANWRRASAAAAEARRK
jgi:hypothetical protein